MIKQDDLIEIGYVKRPHGFKGGIQFSLNKEIALDKGDFVFIKLDGQLIPYPITQISLSDQPVVNLRFIDDHEQAQSLVGHTVYVEGVENLDEQWQLLGYTLTDESLGEIGIIEDVQEFPSQWMLVVQYRGEEVLVPFVEDFILEIDTENKQIRCNLPEGLI